MSLLESYDKNKKKHLGKVVVYEDDEKVLIKEVSVAAGAETFTGRAGDYIDKRFAGAFHPKFGELKDLLKLQVDGDIIKRMYSDDNTPFAEQEFIDVDWKYEYDEYVKQDNSKFKSDSETEMQLVDLEIKYDKIEDKTEENKKYINDTNDWKSIYDSKKY